MEVINYRMVDTCLGLARTGQLFCKPSRHLRFYDFHHPLTGERLSQYYIAVPLLAITTLKRRS